MPRSSVNSHLRWGNYVMQDSCLVHCDEWPYVLWQDHGRIIYGADEMHMAERSAMWCRFPPPGSTTGTLLSYILRSNTMRQRETERGRERGRKIPEQAMRWHPVSEVGLNVPWNIPWMLYSLPRLLLKQCWNRVIPRTVLNIVSAWKLFMPLILVPSRSPTTSHTSHTRILIDL